MYFLRFSAENPTTINRRDGGLRSPFGRDGPVGYRVRLYSQIIVHAQGITNGGKLAESAGEGMR